MSSWSAMVNVIAVLNVLKTFGDVVSSDIATCDNGLGLLVYERIPGFHLQGYNEDQLSKSVLPLQLLEECRRACLQDLTVQNNLLRPCGSIDFSPGKPYSDGQYEPSTCRLTEEKAVPDGIGTLIRGSEHVHFNEICMPSEPISRHCANSLYVFERHPEKGFRPVDDSCIEISATDRQHCERACLTSEDVVCRSATYSSMNATCLLCPTTWRVNPALLQDAVNDEYLENLCLPSSSRCENPSHLVYVEEAHRSLKSAAKLARFRDLTIEQCKAKCAASDRLYCRSLEFRPATNGTGDCYLMEEDSLNFSPLLDTADERLDDTLMELTCLEHDIYRPVAGRSSDADISRQSANFRFFNREGLRRESEKEYVTAFRRYSKKRLEGAESLIKLTDTSPQMCLLACLKTNRCQSATQSRKYSTCELYTLKDGLRTARLVYHDDYDYYENLIGETYVSTDDSPETQRDSVLKNAVDEDDVGERQSADGPETRGSFSGGGNFQNINSNHFRLQNQQRTGSNFGQQGFLAQGGGDSDGYNLQGLNEQKEASTGSIDMSMFDDEQELDGQRAASAAVSGSHRFRAIGQRAGSAGTSSFESGGRHSGGSTRAQFSHSSSGGFSFGRGVSLPRDQDGFVSLAGIREQSLGAGGSDHRLGGGSAGSRGLHRAPISGGFGRRPHVASGPARGGGTDDGYLPAASDFENVSTAPEAVDSDSDSTRSAADADESRVIAPGGGWDDWRYGRRSDGLEQTAEETAATAGQTDSGRTETVVVTAPPTAAANSSAAAADSSGHRDGFPGSGSHRQPVRNGAGGSFGQSSNSFGHNSGFGFQQSGFNQAGAFQSGSDVGFQDDNRGAFGFQFSGGNGAAVGGGVQGSNFRGGNAAQFGTSRFPERGNPPAQFGGFGGGRETRLESSVGASFNGAVSQNGLDDFRQTSGFGAAGNRFQSNGAAGFGGAGTQFQSTAAGFGGAGNRFQSTAAGFGGAGNRFQSTAAGFGGAGNRFQSTAAGFGGAGNRFQNTAAGFVSRFPADDSRFGRQEQQQARACYTDRFSLKETGRRLVPSHLQESVSVSSLSQCEDECVRNSKFICKSLSYRYSSSDSTASLDNCELSDLDTSSLDASQTEEHFEANRDYDFYERSLHESCPPGRRRPGSAGQSAQPADTTISFNSLGSGASTSGGSRRGPTGVAGAPSSGFLGGFNGGPSGSGLLEGQFAIGSGAEFVGGHNGISEGGFISTDGGDVTATCDENGMELTLAANAPFYGRIYTFRHYDQCSVVGRGERITSLRISGEGGNPACGTQTLGDSMQNIVVVQFSEFVQTNFDKRYNLTCYIHGPGEAVVTSGYISASPGQLTPIIDLPAREVLDSRVRLSILYEGRPTTTIAVGDPLLFRLETQTGANLVSDVFAYNVIARDPYSGRSVQLIDEFGCPTDPRLFPALGLGRDGNGLETRFNAFKIPQSNYLLFEATVRPCRQQCKPATCAVDGRQEMSFGRRRRRALNAVRRLHDPATRPVESLDADSSDGESEEHIRRLISVYYTRDELQAADGRTEASVASLRVCIASGEYYGMLAAILMLLIVLASAACIAGVLYRRQRLVQLKNRSVDASSPALPPRPVWHHARPPRQSSMLAGVFPYGSTNSAFSADPTDPVCSRPRRLEDPSEPMCTDPTLFEPSRQSIGRHSAELRD